MYLTTTELRPELERAKELNPVYQNAPTAHLAVGGDEAGFAWLVSPNRTTMPLGHFHIPDGTFHLYPEMVAPDRRRDVGHLALQARFDAYRANDRLLKVDNRDTTDLMRAQHDRLRSLGLLGAVANKLLLRPFDSLASFQLGVSKGDVMLKMRGAQYKSRPYHHFAALSTPLGVAATNSRGRLDTFIPAKVVPRAEIGAVTDLVEDLLATTASKHLDPVTLAKK